MANKKNLVLYISKEIYINGFVRYSITSNQSSETHLFDPAFPADLNKLKIGTLDFEYSEKLFKEALRRVLGNLPRSNGSDTFEKGKKIQYEVKYNTEYCQYGDLVRNESSNYVFDNPSAKVGLKDYEIDFFMKVIFYLQSEMGIHKTSL